MDKSASQNVLTEKPVDGKWRMTHDVSLKWLESFIQIQQCSLLHNLEQEH